MPHRLRVFIWVERALVSSLIRHSNFEAALTSWTIGIFGFGTLQSGFMLTILARVSPLFGAAFNRGIGAQPWSAAFSDLP